MDMRPGGLCSLPIELLRSILLDVGPLDVITLASVNRHLRRAVPACIDFALASDHITPLDLWFGNPLTYIPFEHPLLFEHSVAAISRFQIVLDDLEYMWGEDWLPRGMDAKKEEIRLIRVRALRAAVQRALWPTLDDENAPLNPSKSKAEMYKLEDAVAIGRLISSKTSVAPPGGLC
ncbi:hypothetical protein HDU96_006399 [Phlyctochytrium bullatum]|nr:hypothetical protein HDU96_006399 [Phlyctochytrium bullatum]